MMLNVGKELAALERMSPGILTRLLEPTASDQGSGSPRSSRPGYDRTVTLPQPPTSSRLSSS